MSLPAILIGLALLLLTIPFVAGPLLNKNRQEPLVAGLPSNTPQDRREHTLLALRDLDFDYQLGVVAEGDYARLRAQLLAEAAQAIEQADRLQIDLDAHIETAVRARRRQGANGRVCLQCGAALQPADRFCSRCGARTASECPACSQPVQQGDQFCAGCGERLAG